MKITWVNEDYIHDTDENKLGQSFLHVTSTSSVL